MTSAAALEQKGPAVKTLEKVQDELSSQGSLSRSDKPIPVWGYQRSRSSFQVFCFLVASCVAHGVASVMVVNNFDFLLNFGLWNLIFLLSLTVLLDAKVGAFKETGGTGIDFSPTEMRALWGRWNSTIQNKPRSQHCFVNVNAVLMSMSAFHVSLFAVEFISH